MLEAVLTAPPGVSHRWHHAIVTSHQSSPPPHPLASAPTSCLTLHPTGLALALPLFYSPSLWPSYTSVTAATHVLSGTGG